MRIMFVSIEYPPETGWGGIGTYTRTMARALRQRGHDVHVLSVAAAQVARDYVDEGVHIHRRLRPHFPFVSACSRVFQMKKTYARLAGAVGVRAALHSLPIPCDVVEVPDWSAEGLFLTRQQTGAPVVLQLHTPLRVLARWSGLRPTPDLAVAAWLEGIPLHHTDAIVSPTVALAQDVARVYRVDRSRISILPLPVEVPPIAGPTGHSPLRVLFVGRLEPRKNPLAIMRAARPVLQQLPNTEFLFCGIVAPKYRAVLEHEARELGIVQAVRFLGPYRPDELYRLRASAHVCVVPSWYENFPYVVVEAMASGRPVVASRVGGIPEIVEDGRTGYLVDPDDVAAWAERITSVLRNPVLGEEMGRRGRDVVMDRFHPDRIAAAREVLYAAVCAQRLDRIPAEEVLP